MLGGIFTFENLIGNMNLFYFISSISWSPIVSIAGKSLKTVKPEGIYKY